MAGSQRDPRLTYAHLYDLTPLPDTIPKVKEIGASSAPLLSAAYFIGARCKSYNDDYMKCKEDSAGRGELECMQEGRKVTRCARSVITDINKHCLEQFREHWHCLENRNHQLYNCRKQEWSLNKCVFENIGLVKEIPGAPKDEVPVHLRDRSRFGVHPFSQGTPWVPPTQGEPASK